MDGLAWFTIELPSKRLEKSQAFLSSRLWKDSTSADYHHKNSTVFFEKGRESGENVFKNCVLSKHLLVSKVTDNTVRVDS